MESPEAAVDRRRKEAVVEEFSAEILIRKGDVKEARKSLDRARSGDPDLPGTAAHRGARPLW